MNEKILELFHNIGRKMNATGSDHQLNIVKELTMAQFRILITIKEMGEVTMTKLAELMKITGASMTEHIDMLVNSDLVIRTKSEHDRRCVIVKISTKGQKLFAKLYKHKMETMNNMLQVLTKKDKEQFVNLLEKIEASISTT